MTLLKKIFNLDIVQKYISICENIELKNPKIVNNGLGVNFSPEGIESVKIYYGFHHKLLPEEVKSLHIFGKEELFNEMISSLKPEHYLYHPYYPTGVSFAIKVDRNLKVTMGHFMMPDIEKNDLFFSLEKVIDHFKSKEQFPGLKRKGIFTLIDQYQNFHHKDYYYISDSDLKYKIGLDFKVNTNLVPSIEWVLGKGFYSGSDINDEKIVLQSNYPAVYDKIIKNEDSEFIIKFNEKLKNDLKIYCVCPGFYRNKNIKSYYYFNSENTSPTLINTIPKLKKYLKSVNH